MRSIMMSLNELIRKDLNILNEAISLSQAKPYIKEFVRDRYVEIFNKYKKSWQKTNYRIFIPFTGTQISTEDIEIPYEIKSFLNSKNIKIDDYIKGYGIDDKGRKIKLGKVLQDNPNILQKFVNDEQRKAGKNTDFYAVISRHPYDIAGMSTGRGFESCLNIEHGCNAHKVIEDVREGTLVAYCITDTDKNIQHPLGRLRIHPYVNSNDKIIFGREYTEYGSVPNQFFKIIDQWINEVNNAYAGDISGVFHKSKETYIDTADTSIIHNIDKITEDQYKNMSTEDQGILLFKNFDRFSKYLNKDIMEKIIDEFIITNEFIVMKEDNTYDFKEFIQLLYKHKVDKEHLHKFIKGTFGVKENSLQYDFKVEDYDELLTLIKYNIYFMNIYKKDLSSKQLITLFYENPDIITVLTGYQIDKILKDYCEKFVYKIKETNEGWILANILDKNQQKTVANYIVDKEQYIKLFGYLDDDIKDLYIKQNAKVMKYYNYSLDLNIDTIIDSLKSNIDNIQYVPYDVFNTKAKSNKIMDYIVEQIKDPTILCNSTNKIFLTARENKNLMFDILSHYKYIAPYFYYWSNNDKQNMIYNMFVDNEKYKEIFNIIVFINMNPISLDGIQITKKGGIYTYELRIDDRNHKFPKDIDNIGLLNKPIINKDTHTIKTTISISKK